MPSKAEFYRQMAEHVSTQLVGSWKEWTAFLTTAARLYKYPFHEQMMIYAQRPDATACAEYDLWNEKMGRYVRRGTKGIALVDDSSDKPRLRYVFDIPALPGCGSWRNSTSGLCRPCWSATTALPVMISPSSSLMWPESWRVSIGTNISRTSAISLTVRSWRSTMISTSTSNLSPPPPSAYLWQTVENKQKFISQIMTSKSPVRSCDDVDEMALSFAEIKALCAGNPRIKERMDLDVEVSKLKLMKADHQSKQYRLEDQLLKYFPEEIEKHKGFIQGFEADLETLAAHPHPEDGFAGVEIRGDTLTDKENAGAALLDACKEVKGSEPVQIGSYRGFAMSVEFSAWKQEYTLLLKGQMTHRASLGTDPRGNLTRIDNALAQMSQSLEATKAQLDNLYQQQAAVKEEVGKPFPYEDDLRVKSARLVELDTLLNLDGRGRSQLESVIAKSARPSVLDSLKRQVPPLSPEKIPKQHEEVR